MNATLQAERDLRARIKARLDHGCLRQNCQEHGPADAADIMLVSCIYTAEHVRQYGTATDAVAAATQRRRIASVKPEENPRTHPLASMTDEEKLTTIDDYSSQITDLTSERDQLRKEVEEFKQTNALLSDSRDRWKLAAKEAREDANRNGLERDSALAKLASFQWKPCSENKPTEADADENGELWFKDRAGGFWNDRWTFAINGTYEFWMTPIPLPPESPPLTPEQKEREKFLAHWNSDSDPNPGEVWATADVKEKAWSAWQAAVKGGTDA